MDSPEFSKIKANAASSSDSPPVQESPVFSYLNNLSPIKQVKATHVAQGFAGLSSPPLVFTSPHINSQREASFLRRPQIAQLFSSEKLETQDEAKNHINQSHMGLITDTREHETITCRESEGCSSSEGVDEYLADPTEVECLSSAQSVNPCLKESDNDAKQLIGSKEITLFDNKNDTGTYSGMGAELASITSEHDEDLERMQTFDAKPVKIKGQTANELPNVESGLSVDNAFNREYHQDLHDQLQDIGGSHLDDCDHTSQSPTGHSQPAPRYEDCVENVDAISKGMIGNMILHDSKAKSDQCGMHRRCLQFEEAAPCVTGKGESSLGPREKVNNSEPHPGTADSEMVKSSYADLKAAAKRQVGTSLPPQSPLSVSKPSGIGLHLNSIVKVAPVVQGSVTSIKLDNYVGVKVMNSASIMSCHLPENVSSTLLIEAENYSAGAEESNEIENSITANSAITQSQRTVEFEHNGLPHEKRKFDSPSIDSYNKFSHSIAKEKRKRTSRNEESAGCKRCNCKRSKCLKLYCDCFAAGVYCIESCTCQGCFNKPIYEDTVLETRQQIESRNPLAFAPKIVQTEEEIQFTPSSGRHKRGCNCKKSMCLKKYCECYQANVGCSSGCRCEGCENVYGRKGDYNPVELAMTKYMVSDVSQERIESTFEEKLEMVATKKDTLSTELYDSHSLSPLTPSFQCSEHANNVPKSLCLPTTYGPSPESGLTNISSYEKATRYPPRNAENGDSTLESSKELSNMASYGWHVDYDNNGIVDTLSPTCNAAPPTCHTSPMPDVCSMAMASSTSSRRSDLTNASDAQLCHGSHGLSSGSSFQWHTSPVTPMTRLGATKSFQGIDSDTGPYDPLQDDTPEILKDTPSPVKTVKVSSPNKKRVSPPHSHIRALSASSSGALRSGRKFILKAVPSFPPLTPCINSKGSSITQNTSNLQDKGLNK